VVVGATVIYMHQVFGIGSAQVAAPQATLMATIITGLLDQNLPWGLVLVGVFIAVTLELCGIHSLSFSVGAYLPIATTAPIFAGGLVRWFVERRTGTTRESDIGPGTLFSSGLIAGGSIAGILFAVAVGSGLASGAPAAEGAGTIQRLGQLIPWFNGENLVGNMAGALLFFALAALVARAAMKRMDES
jgi:uncharacterized oligopeptide transporter (OPT) family protein